MNAPAPWSWGGQVEFPFAISQGGLSIQVKTPAADPEANPEGNTIESESSCSRGSRLERDRGWLQ